jgi:hypothetical protein
MSDYEKLRDINVSEWAEKKGNFNYLSWAHAVDQLGKAYPAATWTVREWDGFPFIVGPKGGFVCVSVTVEDVTKTQWHPILDNRNKPIADPDPFHVNTAIQRCLAKAIGLHGLGIGLYCGEDLVQYDDPENDSSESGGGDKGQGQKSSSGGGTGAQDTNHRPAAVDRYKKAGLEGWQILAFIQSTPKGKNKKILDDLTKAQWKWLDSPDTIADICKWVSENNPFDPNDDVPF